MSKITPESLRQLTQDAIKSANIRREKELQLEEARIYGRLQEQELKARGIIAQIPGRAETEALAGRNHAIVMALKYGADFDIDFEQRSNDQHNCFRRVNPAGLSHAARLVYEYCLGADLKPSFEFWHDGVGVNSGWNIVIHW